MIHLDVSKYCSNCPGFEPVVEAKNIIHSDGGFQMVDTVVTCENAGKCRSIYAYIQDEYENEEKLPL